MQPPCCRAAGNTGQILIAGRRPNQPIANRIDRAAKRLLDLGPMACLARSGEGSDRRSVGAGGVGDRVRLLRRNNDRDFEGASF